MSTTPEAVVAATMSLRWAKCGDVYYAALLVPNEEAPIPVESGHAFVIFLGDETGAALPVGDIEPYDPHDITRTSHPEAAAGALIAQQLIAGAEAAAAGAQEEEEEWESEIMKRSDHSRHLHEGSPDKTKKKKSKSKEKHVHKNDEMAEEDGELMTRRVRPKKVRRHGSEEEEDNEEETTLLPSQTGGKRSRRERDDDDDDDDDTRGSSELTGDWQNPQNHWDEMEEEFNLSSPSRMNGRIEGNTNTRSNKRSTGLTAAAAAAASQQIDLYGGAKVTPFLAEIHHHYIKALVEASEGNGVVNIQECDLVRAVEQELLSWSGEVRYLEHLLQDVEHEYNSLVSETPQNDSNSAATLEEESAAIRNRLSRLKSSFSLERIVRDYLRVREKPSERRERRRPLHLSSSAAGGATAVGTTTFIDASMAYLLDSKAAAAVPRELTQSLAQRYRDQRVRRERLLSSQQGLGKMGFVAPVSRVMEKWRRSRELMLIDPCRASQPVSRRFSESLATVERHALKCLSAYSTGLSGGAGGHSVDRLRLVYQQQQQQRMLRTPVNLYHFNDLNEGETQLAPEVYQASSSHPYMHNSGFHHGHNINGDKNNSNLNNNGDEADAGQNAFQVPLISPLRTSFDPRATFAVDPGEMMHEEAVAEQLAMRSMQYSQSIFLPSEETRWEGSEAYDARQRRKLTTTTTTGGRGAGRRSMSRASSRASSVVSDHTNCYNSSNYSNYSKSINNGSKKSEAGRQPAGDWRASAKRTILEQLTLYLRGRRGKPAVLNKEEFQYIAKKLLDRAVRSESERTGLSMSLQANNANAPFTKVIELRLRKSVDNYIQRHFVEVRTLSQPQSYERHGRSAEATAVTSMERTTPARRAAAQRPEDEDETRSVMGAHPHATDSPVYDDL